jgi:F-type H+-transporting ATPase subunit c
MDAEAAQMIGAGLACVALAGVGIGLGNLFATSIATFGRNPSVMGKLQPIMLLGFALVEATGLFALVIAFILVFR